MNSSSRGATDIPVSVQQVVVHGVGKTKDDFIAKNVVPLFKATTFGEILQGIEDTKLRFRNHEVFKSMSAKIDTAPGKDGYRVVFNAEETYTLAGRPFFIGAGTNEVVVESSGHLRNLFGRAEKMKLEYNYGSRDSQGFRVRFTKPINGDPDIQLGASADTGHIDFPWSGYKQFDKGVGVDLSFPSLLGFHTLKWQGVWRDLRCLSNTTSFPVREHAGHSIKSSLKHVFLRDSRDNAFLPSEGRALRLTQELAGLGGDTKFFKSDFEIQGNKKLFLDTVIQLSLGGGLVQPLEGNKKIHINDKIFLGGPLTLRGFNLNGVGPHSNGDALGADSYWRGALHIYSPFPFKSISEGFGKRFRSQFFVNAGNCWGTSQLGFSTNMRENARLLTDGMRLSYGVGVVLSLWNARLEANYVIPVRTQKGDSVKAGLQFGVGIDFL